MNETAPELHDYWDSFYTSKERSAVPDNPSDFARWVNDTAPAGQCLVEFGFGTARDAFWFARNGREVVAYDFAESAVYSAQRTADSEGLPAAFYVMDLYDSAGVGSAAELIIGLEGPLSLYGRFLLHSLEDRGRHNLFELASKTLAGGGRLYLEFRTGEDRDAEHRFGNDHFRNYLDPQQVIRELQELGGTIDHFDAGHGFAIYKDEDPHVARIVTRWEA